MTFTCPLQDLHEQYIKSKVNEVYKIPQNASDEFMYSDFNTSLQLFPSLDSQSSEDERSRFVLKCEKIKFKMLSFHFTYCDFSP
jgi:hypothetical protein